MNVAELFQSQTQEGATKWFFYGLQQPDTDTITIASHKDTLDKFPTDLEFVEMFTPSTPLFKKVKS